MKGKLNIALSLAAGLLGGMLTHYVPAVVHAQAPPSVPQALYAQRFVLVNNKNVPLGVFGIDADGSASITLLDPSGRVLWKENGKASGRALAVNVSK